MHSRFVVPPEKDSSFSCPHPVNSVVCFHIRCGSFFIKANFFFSFSTNAELKFFYITFRLLIWISIFHFKFFFGNKSLNCCLLDVSGCLPIFFWKMANLFERPIDACFDQSHFCFRFSATFFFVYLTNTSAKIPILPKTLHGQV